MDWKRLATPRVFVAAAVFTAILALAIVVLSLMSKSDATVDSDVTEIVDIGGPFTLTDQNGQQVSDTKWRGKIMVIYFGYTYCPDVCPTTLQKITTAMNTLSPKEQGSLQPLFITLDPERDTPTVLAGYTPLFDRRIIGLTGSDDAIESLARAYKVFYQKVPGKTADDYSIDHSSAIYIMDRDGHYLDMLSDQWTPEQMAAHLRTDIHQKTRHRAADSGATP